MAYSREFKEEFLKALSDNLGIVKAACKSMNDLPRKTYYEWLKNDEWFAEKVKEIEEEGIDFVESKMIQKISGVKVDRNGSVYSVPPSDNMIKFYLERKGKSRGYGNRVEITGKDGEDLLKSLSDEELAIRAAEILNEMKGKKKE